MFDIQVLEPLFRSLQLGKLEIKALLIVFLIRFLECRLRNTYEGKSSQHSILLLFHCLIPPIQ